MTVDDLTPQEIAAALAARRELGAEYEREIAASLADRMQRRIDAEVSARSGEDQKSAPSPRHDLEIADSVTARWTALGSLAAGTIVTITTSGSDTDHGATSATWFGIIVINLAVNLGRRRRRNRG
ncbi:MAG: hypothetical protein HOW97_18585 [Catenulispora sp.]|nr:hypothetical protein [Catenulispora sp.]